MMKRRVQFVLLSFIAVLVQAVLSSVTRAEPATIMHETFKGDAIITRNVTAPKPGAYLLILKNGTAGPHDIEQCDVEDSDEEKTECRSRNLSENVDHDFSRTKEAEIKINGRWVQGITNARSLLIVPVTLKGGTNKIDLKLQGRSSSKLTVSLELAPQAALPPEAAFLVNRLINPARTPFTFDGKESFSPNGNSLRYSWNFGDGTIENGKSRVSHSFSKPGTYSVQLTVTDQATRLSSSFSVDVTVLSIDKTKPPKNEKPKPVIQYALDTVNPLNVTFDGTSSTDDGTIVSYRWQITDENHEHRHGSTVERTGAQFDYTFPRAGSYTVRLTVKDNQGAEAATERVVSTSDMSGLVRDESLFGPKKYYSKKKVIESFALESPRLAVLKIKNADGLEHPIESCSSTPWPEKLGCLFQNSVNRAYVALYRVSQAEVFINGQRVTDRIGKHTAYFETVVSLQTSNTIEIRTKGWPTAFIELELQSLEVNEAPIVYVTHSDPRRGIPQLIEFDASTSVDMNDHIMSYRFQAFKADGAVAIDTDWQGASYAALEFTESGAFTVIVSARDTFGTVGTKSLPITIESNQLPLLTASYVALSNQAPYQVRVTAIASDPDGDAIQYNFAYSTGQVSGFQDSPQGLTSFASAGTYSVDVTARDINGGIATFTLPITVGGNLLPIANFDFVTDRGGYAPLTITVDASPSSDPDDATETLRYFWTFGDNSPRVEGKMLSHTFINQGQYTVTLSVLDPKRGLSTKSRAAFAWRTTPPNPVLIANPRVGPASLTVDFDASQSTPGASPIASYLFDYNDGTFESSLTPFKTHTFTQPGIYNVGLIVYDTDGNGNIGGQTIYVFDGKKPSAAIQVVSSDVITPARFELLGSGVSPNPLATITDYKWTLPNGTVQTGPSLIYTTSTNGNFAIKLEVKDSYGYWSDPASIDLSAATGTLPIAQITADKTRIALGQAVKLSGLNSYTSNGQANLVSYEWTLPNGTKIYGPEKTVTLSATGLKTISLVVTDSKGYVSNPSTIQIQVDARQTPSAVITASTSGTVIPVTATANGLQSTTPNPGATITGYEWRLQAPDATPPLDIQAFGPEIQGVLTWPVNYTLSLRVFDSAGAVSGWVSHTFGPLLNTPPIAVITPSSVIDTAPTTVTLSSIGSTDPDGHNIINAHWIFSDGGEYWGLIAPYYIASPGSYTATVRVLDEYGAWSDPVTIPITLNANLPPVALMTAAPDTNNKFNFTFDASTSFDLDGTIARYDWFFSDGFVSLGAGSAISHAFPAAGTWRAGVNVFDNKGAMATVQVEVTVSANQPPVAKIKVLSTDHANRTVSFSASESTHESAIQSYTWDFGDGTTGTGENVNHTFDDDGQYDITLTVLDVTAQKAAASAEVYIASQPLQIVASVSNDKFKTEVGPGKTLAVPRLKSYVEFSLRSGGQDILDIPINWNYGDGTSETASKAGRMFFSPDEQTVTATFVDQNGQTVTQSLKISTATDACINNVGDTNCARIENSQAGTISSADASLILGIADVDLVGIKNLFVEINQGSSTRTVDPTLITVQDQTIRIPMSELSVAPLDPSAPYEIRVVFEDKDEEPIGASIQEIQFRNSSLHIAKAVSFGDLDLSIQDVERKTVQTVRLIDGGVLIDQLAPGVYTIRGEADDKFVYGSISLIGNSAQEFTIEPQLTPADAMLKSVRPVVAATATAQAVSSKSIVDSGSTNSKTSVSSLNATETSGCMYNGQPCFYAAFASDYTYMFGQQWPYQEVELGPTSPLYSNEKTYGFWSIINEKSIRGIDDRFNVFPGELLEVECKGYTSRWDYELLGDPTSEIAHANDLAKASQDALASILASYDSLPSYAKCGWNAPAINCSSIPEWNSYVAFRSTKEPIMQAWDTYFQNQYDRDFFTYGARGKVSQHQVFYATVLLTRYNQNGSLYRNAQNKIETKELVIPYDTSKMRGNYSRSDVGNLLGTEPFRQDSLGINSAVVRDSVRIPAHWADYRVNVKITAKNTFTVGRFKTPIADLHVIPKSTFACRPTFKVPAVDIVAGLTPKETLTALATQIDDNSLADTAWWAYLGKPHTGDVWNNLLSASIAIQQRYLESRSLANDANPTSTLPSPTVRLMAKGFLENYVSSTVWGNFPSKLFPMTIDTDASDHRNPAYNALLINDNGTFSGSRITAANLDIVSRLRLQARGVKTINSVHILMNGTRFHSITFSPAVKVAWGLNTAETPAIRIPYSAILAALPAGSQANGDKFKLGFEFDVTTKESQPLTIVTNDTIEFLPVWNLKPEVTAASDIGNGLYSLKTSAYGSYKLRTFVRSMVAHRTAMQSDSTKAFNLYINDGSLPFGGSFSGVHNTHNTGNILDMRPLGNSGASSQHYDSNAGSRRLADLAVIWAESIYRNEQCNSLTRESAEHIACEATATTHFQTEFDIDHPSDTFQTKRARLVRWINLNQQLGSIPIPAGAKSLQFNFSDGLLKFNGLCQAMLTAYQSGTNQLIPVEGCVQKIDHTSFEKSDIQFQLPTKLPSGVLPNGDVVLGTLQQSPFTSSRLKTFKASELLHYDHFHLEINE